MQHTREVAGDRVSRVFEFQRKNSGGRMLSLLWPGEELLKALSMLSVERLSFATALGMVRGKQRETGRGLTLSCKVV